MILQCWGVLCQDAAFNIFHHIMLLAHECFSALVMFKLCKMVFGRKYNSFFFSIYQSWEKTVDCYSPGQGLMPASFKVRSVPLDGNSEAFEEVLDPDFGE